MRKYILFLSFVLLPLYIFGQSNGDWQTRTSGSFEDSSTWQIYNNGWKDAGPGDGLLGDGTPYGFSGNVWIRDGHSVNANDPVLSFGTSAHLIVDQGGTIDFGDIVLSGFNPPYLAFLTINGTLNTDAGINIDIITIGSTGLLNTSWRKSDGSPGWWASTKRPSFSSCTFDGTIEYSGLNQKISSVGGEDMNNIVISGEQDSLMIDSTYNINGSLTIKSISDLSIPSGTVVNGNDILIESDALSTGSLICNGTFNLADTLSVQRYMTGSRFHFVSAPVSGYPISQYISDNTIDANNDSTQYAMTTYNQDSSDWNAFFPVSGTPTENMGAGLGYLAGIKGTGITTFNGGLRTSDVAVPVTNGGDALNLLGNPFTSAIAITSSAEGSSDYFLSGSNTDVLDTESVCIWVYDPTKNNNKGGYSVYSETEGDDYIPIGMGFFIKAGSNGNIELNTDMQTHNVNAVFLKKSVSEKVKFPLIQLNVNTIEESSVAKIYFIENITRGLDPGWDISTLKQEGEFQIYSKLLEGSESKFHIQCVPYSGYGSTSVELGIDAPEGGIIKISADVFSMPANSKAILEDRELGILTDLKVAGSEYNIELGPDSNVEGRFFLHTFQPVTSTENKDDFQNISIFAHQKEIFIQGEVEQGTRLNVYDVSGRRLKTSDLLPHKNNRLKVDELKEGIYIIHLVRNNKRKVAKIFLK